MQTRDKKRNFFGGYRHGNKSMPKLTGHTRQKSSASNNNNDNNNDDEIDEETKKKTQIEKALEKANAAVLFDSANNFKGAIKFYEEAVILLQDVLLADPFRSDRLRLQNIVSIFSSSSFLFSSFLLHPLVYSPPLRSLLFPNSFFVITIIIIINDWLPGGRIAA